MTYKWEWSNKLQSEMTSPVDKDGYRFLLTVSPGGEYNVVKFLVKNSFNIPFSQARPNLITRGWAETVELGKEKAEQAFEKFTGIKRETKPVKAVEPVEKPAEITADIPVGAPEPQPAEEETDAPVILEVLFEPAEDKLKMTILDSDLEQQGVKIKYTINGKPVQTNSRNYTGPILVNPGTTVILKKFIGDATVDKTVIAEI